MLRIKKEVDLKELEKFGLTCNDYVYSIWFDNYGMEIDKKSRILKLYADDNYDFWKDDCNIDMSIMYDLIVAGLVEKIEE